MSRIGKQSIEIPKGVIVDIDGKSIKVKGPKGELFKELPGLITIDKSDEEIKISVKNPNEKSGRAYWGLSRMLVANNNQQAGSS